MTRRHVFWIASSTIRCATKILHQLVRVLLGTERADPVRYRSAFQAPALMPTSAPFPYFVFTATLRRCEMWTKPTPLHPLDHRSTSSASRPTLRRRLTESNFCQSETLRDACIIQIEMFGVVYLCTRCMIFMCRPLSYQTEMY